ncbi:DUF4158 domain-containing protein [Sphingomonas silueang]|uniref:DUF4158 domain-containing protein n=1 Tax=Sphingomonas silueang TaxID=3156617 RepID=UPI003CCCB5B1
MPARIPMTGRQRAALLALPDTEAMVVRHHSLDAGDLDAIGTARTPATRLGYALQLCCLRYPGRHLRAGELLPAIMLDHIAEQIGVEADAIADFARRTPTRYDQLATIKARFGFRDLSRPVRADLMTWLGQTAMPLTDGCHLLDRLLEKMRAERIVIPGISVVERMAAEAMHRAETDLITAVDRSLDAEMRRRLDTLVDGKVHDRQSRLSWLREPQPRVAPASLDTIVDKVRLIRWSGVSAHPVDPAHQPRIAQFAREGLRYTAQAFQQMRPARRRTVLLATLREMEATLTDAAIAMFGRARLRARKRLEQRVAVSNREGRERLLRVAVLLETVAKAARAGEDVGAAVNRITTLDTLDADAAIIRRTASSHRDDVLGEIAPEYRAFKRSGPAFLRAFDFQGRAHTQSLRSAMTILADLDGDWRRSLPDDVPLGHVERRWRRHVGHAGAIDRASWEMATYEALAGALASSDIWVPTAKVHRALRALLAPAPGAPPRPAILPGDVHALLDERANRLDTALLAVEQNLGQRDAVFFEGDRLRFPREPSDDTDRDGGRRFALA